MRMLVVLPFVLLVILCWGNYGPLMHEGQDGMGGSSLRPFICVGAAYFLIAILVPLILLKARREAGKWTFSGMIWSLVAGVVGAFGAFGVIMAFKFGGKPLYVMPLVFGCAPVVNTFVTMLMSRTFKEAKPIFFLGVLLVALGAAGVLYYKPVKPVPAQQQKKAAPDPMMISLAVALAALSWGSYGPVLHKGQMKMHGSRLRPFLCVGVSYFAVAVVAPSLWLMQQPEKGEWTPAVAESSEHLLVIQNRSYDGIVWSLAGGAAGAIGALGVIMAFNFGGKPIFVMPLIFGGAPVVNTLTTITSENTWSLIKAPFVISLGVVIAGAMMVLIFAPKPAHPARHPSPPGTPPPPDSRADGMRSLLGQNP